MDINMKLMGSRIRAFRKMRDMTSLELSGLIGITEESLNHIDSGNRKPSLQTLLNIAEALKASLDYLTGRTVNYEGFSDASVIEEERLTEKQVKALNEAVRALIPVIKKTV